MWEYSDDLTITMDDYMFGEYVALCKYFPEETHYVEILNYSVGVP